MTAQKGQEASPANVTTFTNYTLISFLFVSRFVHKLHFNLHKNSKCYRYKLNKMVIIFRMFDISMLAFSLKKTKQLMLRIEMLTNYVS